MYRSLLAKQRDNGSWSIQEGEVYSDWDGYPDLGCALSFPTLSTEVRRLEALGFQIRPEREL